MRAVLTLVLLLFAQPAGPWTWSQRVEYQENHDPSMVWLRDGRKLQVEFSAIPWETVNKWPAGKALELVYDAEFGQRLVDPESKKALPVLGGLEKHPIDLVLAACLEKNGSTTGMVECYGEAESRWDQELNRAYRALLAPLDEQSKKKVQEAQRAWLGFRDGQLSAISSVYGARAGTMWRIVAARQSMEVVREQALRLASFQAW
jgi:uncharacterized protein YecT (DUF1311 family)